MHTLRNKLLVYGAVLGAGLGSLGLHQYMMDNCFDAKGLLIAGNLPGKLLLAVGAAFAVGMVLLLRTLGGDGEYADNFPRDIPCGLLMLAGGVLLALSVPELAQEEAPASAQLVTGWAAVVGMVMDRAVTVLPWLSALSMLVMGAARLLGRRSSVWFSGTVCLYYMVVLVTSYRLWSADPQLQDYAYQLLAGVLLMLCSFHRTCCDAGIFQRKKLIFTAGAAAVCCMAALSMDFRRGFYLASALWSMGCICTPAVLPPDPEEEPEQQPEETE